MTRSQKLILIVLTIVIALTRFLAVAHSLFDWDEALFTLGVRDYDVTNHHPHPPGYPLFIAAAKLVHLLGIPEFRSLQVIVFLGAVVLFPALFFLAREIGFNFTTSVCGAAIFAFLPNVWIYGGTGFSDVPGAAIGFAACALLLRGRSDKRAYLLGAIVLGIAAGIRPPNLLMGAVPALLATWHQRKAWKHVLLATFLGGAITAGSYAGAALASGSIDGYVDIVKAQSQWVHDKDSYHNPYRASLRHLTKIFFVWPVQQKQQMTALTVLALLSLIAAIVKRRPAPFLTLLLFAPMAIIAWLHFDFAAAARYAIPYMAVHALLAADALGLARSAKLQVALCTVVIAVFVVWTVPALQLQRTSDSPPVAALEWLRANVSASERVYIHGGIGPQAEVFVPGRPNTVFFEESDQVSLLSGDAWIVDLQMKPGAHNFVWPRTNPLWKILRRRNFEASVARETSMITFGEGWHGDEVAFRWMRGESVSQLAVREKGKLRLRLYVPLDLLPSPPVVEVRFNGNTLERFPATSAEIEKTWSVTARPDAPSELRILTSATVNPAKLGRSGDSRDLGLRLDALSWSPQP